MQLGSGFSAEIFFLDVTYTDDAGPQVRTLVLRLQPRNFEVVFGSDLRIQGNMMRALNETGGIPVPAWIGLEEDSSLLGAPFLVMAGWKDNPLRSVRIIMWKVFLSISRRRNGARPGRTP